MENYKVLQRLGKGAQGSVFLAENRIDGRKYVLKKVECNDESEANKAFKEAMALQELKNPYVCGYKEFFVTWDKEESAMFVCIVMEYYKMGDLDKVLRQKRSKKESIEELILKKWFGQMVEALVFVHKKEVIHRDLKPSNIFMTEDLSISIGDFGVATVMGDARTKTRTTVGSMNWMAPEVLERPYDERSDVWSLGCITLEMTTCSFMDTPQAQATLFEIKHSPQILEDVLEEVGKRYSVDLVQLIRTMLRRNFKQRPTAVELTDIPYVKEALGLSSSALVARKKAATKGIEAKPVPKGKGIKAVIEYLKDQEQLEESVKEALVYLGELTKEQDSVVDEAGKKVIVSCMRTNMSNVDIQTEACNVLQNLVVTAEDGDILYTKDVIAPVLLAMRSHAASASLQSAAAQLIMALSGDESAADVIGQAGGVQDVLAAMRQFPNDQKLITNSCGALWSLGVNENNAKIMTEEKGLADVCGALDGHGDIAQLVDYACCAIWSLSMEDDNIEMMADLQTVKLTLNSLKIHKKDAKVAKNACMAMASIVEADVECAYQMQGPTFLPEESAYRLLENEGEAGIPIVLETYELHKDNPEVVENVCTLINELAQYNDLCEELKAAKADQILSEAKIKFASNEDIMGPVTEALRKMAGGAAQKKDKKASKT
ncbi:serine/threonine kinase-like domain-containing protein STKLD1 isoform X2 [Branchiostoma lanceolatum]|uniref:serine/threonine kinase-like domain-containing protein STKLD1 isoform X2 n=1 Tax=Branchiostoma lanceolatum TaxID=7740 RepID=UPI0034570A57